MWRPGDGHCCAQQPSPAEADTPTQGSAAPCLRTMTVDPCACTIKLKKVSSPSHLAPAERIPMTFRCKLSKTTGGQWSARYSGPETGAVEVTAVSREQALQKIRSELRY